MSYLVPSEFVTKMVDAGESKIFMSARDTVICALALIDKRPGVTLGGVLRNWGLVFIGNFAGSLTTAFLMAFVTTFGFTQDPDKVGMVIGNIGEGRTLGYAAHGAAGMATLF